MHAHPKLLSNIFVFIKRIILVCFVFVCVISAFMYFIIKDSPKINTKYIDQSKQEIYTKINDPELKKTESGQLTILLYKSFTCSILGEGCTDNPKDAPFHYNNSLMGRITSWVATPYSIPPASGIAWIQYSIENAGFVPATYAAEGVGFTAIKGYMGIWKVFRNLSFMILVLVMLIIGFLIMFRVKVDAQTVIAMENALPRIVITMLLISFSFAIAGFLIDLMYILIGTLVDIIYGYGLGMDNKTVLEFQNKFISADFGDLWPTQGQKWGAGFFGVGGSIWNMVPGEFRLILDTYVFSQIGVFLSNLQIQKFDDFIKGLENITILGFGPGRLPLIIRGFIILFVSGMITIALPGLILGITIALTILFLMFRIFFILLSSYIKIILYVIFAPVILVMEAIPGQNSFSWWIRNMVGELIVFPVVVMVMLVGNAILYVNFSLYDLNPLQLVEGSRLIAPADESFLLPFLYGFRPDDFNMIVGLGLILLIPDFIKIAKNWVGVSDSGLNLSLGTFFAGGAAIAGGAMGGLSGFNNIRSTLVGADPTKGILEKYKDKAGFKSIFNALKG